MDDIFTLCSQASLVNKDLLQSAENVSKNVTIADWKNIASLLQACNSDWELNSVYAYLVCKTKF